MAKISSVLLRVIEAVCILLLAVVFFSMVIQITCRTFSIGITWTEEIARISFSCMSFIAAPLLLAEGAHIVVDMVVNKFKGIPRRILECLAQGCVMTFCGFALKSLQLYIKANRNISSVSMTWLMMRWVFYIVEASIILLMVVSAVRLALNAMGKPDTTRLLPEEDTQQEELDLDI